MPKILRVNSIDLVKALEHPLTRPLLPLIPERVRSVFLSSEEAEELLRDYVSAEHYFRQFGSNILSGKTAAPVLQPDTKYDFENISRNYKSHFTGTPLTTEIWNNFLDSTGKINVAPIKIASIIFCGGVEPNLRPTVWPFIFKVYSWNSPKGAIKIQMDVKAEKYFHMKQSWADVLNDAGNPSSPKNSHNATTPECAVGDENENSDVVSRLVERKHRIDKDVARTDQTTSFFTVDKSGGNDSLSSTVDKNSELVKMRHILMTFTMFDFETGYVQGMNELLAPLLETIREEVLTFWCFTGLMDRMV